MVMIQFSELKSWAHHKSQEQFCAQSLGVVTVVVENDIGIVKSNNQNGGVSDGGGI